MALRKISIPRRCCGRCAHGTVRKVPAPKSPRYQSALMFNKTSRVCGWIPGGMVQPAWEENDCGDFEEMEAETEPGEG